MQERSARHMKSEPYSSVARQNVDRVVIEPSRDGPVGEFVPGLDGYEPMWPGRQLHARCPLDQGVQCLPGMEVAGPKRKGAPVARNRDQRAGVLDLKAVE